MSKITIDKSHAFPVEEAIERLRALTSYWGKYGLRSSWDGGRARISGTIKSFDVEGEILVEPARATCVVEVSWAAKKLGQGYVEDKIAKYLDPATPAGALARG